MGNFNRGSRSDSRDFRRDPGGRDFEGRGGGRQMHSTTCSSCGKTCEVPFKPTGSKPVFCRDCFQKNGGGDRIKSEKRFDRRPSEYPQYREQFEALNAKLDKIVKLLTPAAPQEVAQVNTEPQEEKAPDEQAVVIGKKKRVSKKTVVTTEE